MFLAPQGAPELKQTVNSGGLYFGGIGELGLDHRPPPGNVDPTTCGDRDPPSPSPQRFANLNAADFGQVVWCPAMRRLRRAILRTTSRAGALYGAFVGDCGVVLGGRRRARPHRVLWTTSRTAVAISTRTKNARVMRWLNIIPVPWLAFAPSHSTNRPFLRATMVIQPFQPTDVLWFQGCPSPQMQSPARRSAVLRFASRHNGRRSGR
jgi:hypothetical protein